MYKQVTFSTPKITEDRAFRELSNAKKRELIASPSSYRYLIGQALIVYSKGKQIYSTFTPYHFGYKATLEEAISRCDCVTASEWCVDVDPEAEWQVVPAYAGLVFDRKKELVAHRTSCIMEWDRKYPDHSKWAFDTFQWFLTKDQSAK